MWYERQNISELRECQLCNVSTTLKPAAEMMSYMKCFVYVDKVKTFKMTKLVVGLQHMML
jgi:hypothetical protein